jgi:hypothetical protein
MVKSVVFTPKVLTLPHPAVNKHTPAGKKVRHPVSARLWYAAHHGKSA